MSSVRKYYVKTPQPGYPFDRKAKKYFSWGFDFWAGGERFQERGFLTKEQAEEVVNAKKAEAKNARHGIRPASRSPYLAELLQAKLDQMTGPERSRAKRVFKAFLALLPREVRVRELESADFTRYNQTRLAAGVSASTIRRELVPLVAALNSAEMEFPELKDYRPPKIPRPRISKIRRTRTINSGERRALLAYLYAPRFSGESLWKMRARHDTAYFLQFALLTTSRPGEVAKLKLTDVDLYSGIVRIVGTKTRYTTGKVRYLPITPTMEKILRNRIENASGEFLFTPNGRVQDRMYKALKAACEANGIRYGKHDLDNVIFYSARHTATTTLVQNQVDTKTAGDFTGHSDETMTLHYSHPNRETINSAADILEQNMGGDYVN